MLSLKKILTNITIHSVIVCLLATASLISIGTKVDLRDAGFFGLFLFEPLRFVKEFLNPPINDTTYICHNNFERTGLLSGAVTILRFRDIKVTDSEIRKFMEDQDKELTLEDLGKFLHFKKVKVIQKELDLKNLIECRKPFMVYSFKYKRYQVVKGILKEKSRVLLGDPVLGNFNTDLFKFMKYNDNKAIFIK